MIIADSPGAVNAAAGGARQQFTPVGEGAAAGVREGREEGGRGERIRTSGLYVPNVALYQAKLHPEGPAEGPTQDIGRRGGSERAIRRESRQL